MQSYGPWSNWSPCDGEQAYETLIKVIAKVKVCHEDNDEDKNDYTAANEDDTRVMTIPQLFFFEKQPS